MLAGEICNGGNLSLPLYSILQPIWRKASTRSPIGRSCIRGTPCKWYWPPDSANAAASGRNAVPALPKNKSAFLLGKLPPQPYTRQSVSLSFSNLTPRVCKASSILSVSSDFSRSRISVMPLERAASNNVRLEMLFEPGSLIVPATFDAGCKVIDSIIYWFSLSFAHWVRALLARSNSVCRPLPSLLLSSVLIWFNSDW